jgi:hypothetical protein
MSDLIKFAGANLPSVQSLSTSLKALSAGLPAAGGVAILKMDKTGHWVFGADQTEVESESRWAINPYSFIHGFIAWGDGAVAGEVMVSVSEPLPDVGAAPPASAKGWETQVGMMLKCISGEDTGLECRFTATSVGGKKAVQELAIALAHQVDKDPSKPVPVVVLKKDHYQHKSYGRIYTPVFEVVEWVSLNGPEREPGEDDDKDDEPAPAPARRTRR